ncbi:hypothetical protein HMPREF1063_05063, partial [Phocaeicola dorei CL02T00C15]
MLQIYIINTAKQKNRSKFSTNTPV